MRLLADTQLLLWLATGDHRLSPYAKSLLIDPSNRVFFSAASIWETAIKFALGRPDFTTRPDELRDGLLLYGFLELQASSDHAIAIANLPSTHGDPFDRLLAALAAVEGLTLITADRTLATYPSTLLV